MFKLRWLAGDLLIMALAVVLISGCGGSKVNPDLTPEPGMSIEDTANQGLAEP